VSDPSAAAPAGAIERTAASERVDQLDRQRLWLAVRLLGFAVLALVLTVQNRTRLTTMVPGDSGDAMLVMTLLEWGGDKSLRAFSGYWDGPMFSAGTDVMAYTDTLLPLVVPFKLLEITTRSRVVAFNTLYLASWVICAEATYHLALRLVRSRSAALIGALGFTFSTIRLTQSNHFQLAWAGFIPLCVLLLFRFWDRPSSGRGALLAAAVIVQLLTSAYYGVIVVVFTTAGVVVAAVIAGTRHRLRPVVAGYATFAVTLLLPLLFIRHQYASAESSTVPRSGYFASPLALGDLRSPSPRATFLRRLDWLDTDTVVRSSENYAYIGLIALVGIPVLAGMIVANRSSAAALLRPVHEWVALLALASFAFLMAVGKGPILGVDMPFYDAAVHLIPGLDSMVALVRLVVFTQLFLSIAAAAVVAAGFRHIDRRWIRCAITAVLALVVIGEARMSHSMVTVADPAPGSVFAEMQHLEPGVVAILPMSKPSLGVPWAFTETPRMSLGSDDRLQSVNGYSGYAPIGYEESASAINRFPDPEAVAELRRLGVRYVAILTTPMRTGMGPGTDDAINATGYAYMDPAEADERIARAPSGLILSRIDAADGVVLELAPED
jgi:hypothetical protein